MPYQPKVKKRPRRSNGPVTTVSPYGPVQSEAALVTELGPNTGMGYTELLLTTVAPEACAKRSPAASPGTGSSAKPVMTVPAMPVTRNSSFESDQVLPGSVASWIDSHWPMAMLVAAVTLIVVSPGLAAALS